MTASASSRVVRDERPCVAHRAEILRGIEAERPGAAGGSCAGIAASRSVRLTGVLDDLEGVSLGERSKRRHVGEAAVEVHGHDGTRSRSQCRGGGGGIHAVVVLGDVDRNGDRARLGHGLERRHERHRGDENLVARFHAQRRRERGGARPARSQRRRSASSRSIRANTASNSATCGPLVNAPERRSSSTSSSTPRATRALTALRSRKRDLRLRVESRHRRMVVRPAATAKARKTAAPGSPLRSAPP